AGGPLIGAVRNMRPEVCRAAVMRVPFVDVINTMLDESLPLTVGEFEEWGNPKIREQYEYMKSYCPYTNLAARAYPAILVKTSLNDSQVMYWEPAKYVAKLRALNHGAPSMLFKINLDAGHGGASGRDLYLRDFRLASVGVREEVFSPCPRPSLGVDCSAPGRFFPPPFFLPRRRLLRGSFFKKRTFFPADRVLRCANSGFKP